MAEDWTADDILRMAGGYKTASVLVAAVELDVFGALGGRELAAAALAAELEADARAMGMLLDALVALDLLEKKEDRYTVPPGLDGLLAESGEHNVVGMLRHHANCLRRWGDLARAVKNGGPVEVQPSIRGNEGDLQSFIAAMNDISQPVAGKLVDALGPFHFRHLLDVGGAMGSWTVAFLRAAPDAKATIFDLPPVIPMARQLMEKLGLSDRVTLAAGDFHTDPLPAGADLAWVSAIIHMNSREENRELFGKVRDALADGGEILIRDVVMDKTRTGPVQGALFAINMLVATPGGGTFTFDEISDDLVSAGFTSVSLLHQDEFMNSVVRARKA